MASKTRIAFSIALGVRILSGVRPLRASCTAVWPLRSAIRIRSAVTAGALAPPATDKPSASAIQAIVLAVPITEQVPTLATNCSLTSLI